MAIKDKIFNFIRGVFVSYYLKELEKVEKKKFSWNWSAFLFGPAWLAYRKMPAYSFISFILLNFIVFGIYDPLMLRVHCRDLLNSPMLYVFLATMLIYMVIHGALGNRLYFRYLKKKKHLETSQPVAPIFGSLSLFFYIDSFEGALWLRCYHMTHNYCSGIFTEIFALLGVFKDWIFVIIIFVILRSAYNVIVRCKRKFVTFNHEIAEKIIKIKPSIVWWLIPTTLIYFLIFYACYSYVRYFKIFLEKIS